MRNRTLGVGLLVLTALCVTVAHACIWDSDTLAAEAKGLPGVADIIVGRFERNPPLYYEMRLARVTAELETSPHKLDLYDDAGAACDRLGRSDDAIAWMTRKHERFNNFSKVPSNDLYRYHANLGTFHAHRWIGSGADRDDLADLKAARDHIARAIEINPDAHFGREKFQLTAIEWLIDPTHEGVSRSGMLDRWHLENDRHLSHHRTAPGDDPVHREAIEGLSGLIALGAAWRSVDVFTALRGELQAEGHSALAHLAHLRSAELIADGRTSLYTGEESMFDNYHSFVEADERLRVEAYFLEARALADEWHLRRTAYMLERLEAGRHPDTDATFWDAWDDEPKLPAMPDRLSLGLRSGNNAAFDIAIFVSLGAIVLAFIVMVIRRVKGVPKRPHRAFRISD